MMPRLLPLLLLLLLLCTACSLAFRGCGLRSSRSALYLLMSSGGSSGSTPINLDPFEEDEERSSQLADDALGAAVGPMPSVSSRINFANIFISSLASEIDL